jgi:hypothetical protein
MMNMDRITSKPPRKSGVKPTDASISPLLVSSRIYSVSFYTMFGFCVEDNMIGEAEEKLRRNRGEPVARKH